MKLVQAAWQGLQAPGRQGTSYAFDVGRDIYKKLKYDALAYFYHNRSGIADRHALRRRSCSWARPAGHLGDKSVPCAPEPKCSYSLDVSGGWYDAGDHGKYVVNGGICAVDAAQPVRARQAPRHVQRRLRRREAQHPREQERRPRHPRRGALGDRVPAPHEVPEGNPLAGMVHHKVHDEKWTALGLPPHEDPMKRFLRPPSTAATLNVAAVAAQAARIWKTIDPAFSARCLAAAERAWAAAQAHPDVYAPPNDNTGGGPYDDKDVDRRGLLGGGGALHHHRQGARTRRHVLQSPHFKVLPPSGAGRPRMTWQSRRRLGTISLAVVPNGLDAAPPRRASRPASSPRPRAYLDVIETQGYRDPARAHRGQGPVGLELASCSTTSIVLGPGRRSLGSEGEPQVPERRGRGDGLHPRPQPHGAVLRHRVRGEARS